MPFFRQDPELGRNGGPNQRRPFKNSDKFHQGVLFNENHCLRRWMSLMKLSKFLVKYAP